MTKREENLLVLADDLTGAGEIASLATKAGFNTSLELNPKEVNLPSHSGDSCTVIDTETREFAGREAKRKVRDLLSTLSSFQGPQYKKIDSTLRGNIVSELEAMGGQESFDLIIFAPALPELGRKTVGGYHMVDGLPVTRTEYASHPSLKLTTSHLPSFFEEAMNSFSTHSIPLRKITEGKEAIKETIRRLYQNGAQLVIPDAAERSDLEEISGAIGELDLNPLPVGSSGLFRALYPGKVSIGDSLPARPGNKPALVICGSINTASRRQLSLLEEKDPEVRPHQVQLESLEKISEEGHNPVVISGVLEDLKGGRDVAVFTPSEPQPLSPSRRERIGEGLGELAAEILRAQSISGLFLTGGDTAKAVFQSLDIRQLDVVGQLEPFIPITSIYFQGSRIPVVTKAGGFGSEQVMIKAKGLFRNEVTE